MFSVEADPLVCPGLTNISSGLTIYGKPGCMASRAGLNVQRRGWSFGLPGSDKRRLWADSDQRGADEMSTRRCQKISAALTKRQPRCCQKISTALIKRQPRCCQKVSAALTNDQHGADKMSASMLTFFGADIFVVNSVWCLQNINLQKKWIFR